MKKLLLATMAIFVWSFASAQTEEEIKAEMGPKKDSIAAIQKRVDALQAQLDALPGWKIGAFGTIGGSLSQFNNWFSQGIPNNSSGNFGFTVNAYANLKEEKYFWRNAANLHLSWVKLDDKDDPNDDDSFRPTTDVFNISSLYGWKLTESFAISALGEYRTTILDNFNDPGYLDLGVGGTWTPIPDLVVVIHPLNYNFVFSSGDDIFESSMGAKIVADYTKKFGDISFKSNLSMFQSYKSSDYSNWTWTNSFSYTLWKMIGVGFDFGLRSNKQETLNYVLNNAPTPDPNATFDNIDNELQTYWTLGLSYKF
ncbi:DUF3078 domain-containing protein [Flagellimonas zhangzhouensis]|uniref:DUF3078 domain-containing protein n=1 Tax=Flagellimonas zhangzhouensis TaxID=1073328 RepID=A0A1H2UJT8_9FLAO|nr:DUF3078 domain-containing protein [Allomuricauda zhangzhouensis]SDQ16358.1 Protein of unknown function [Allomuricauda zhangzhouensis]SDW56395.1 Protein of unknown function [Allomuricauda zhangzhouensis]